MKQADPLHVHRTSDFPVSGRGDNPSWDPAEWHPLAPLDGDLPGYDTRFKILSSPSGLYLLMHGNDRVLTTGNTEDFGDLYTGDVFEVFFHTDPATPLYFEYEINALGNELVLLVPNFGGQYLGWRPWHYEGLRTVRSGVAVEGGRATPGAAIEGWSAEIFFPFGLLKPLENVPPSPGTRWNANFCRLDYDTGTMRRWSYSPVRGNFHDFASFRPIEFQ